MIHSDVVFHFTPGPYTTCQDPDCSGCGNIYAGERRWIGQAFNKAHAADFNANPDFFPDREEQRANERLWTAAPQMARALVAAAHALRSHEKGILSFEVARQTADVCDLALAQVTGSAS